MDTKEKIITAAIDIFAEKGKHGAHMEEIAAKAKVNKAMLYYFYTTRENLYREVLAAIIQRIARHICRAMEESSRKTASHVDRMKALVRSHFEAYSQNLSCTKIMLEAMATDLAEVKKAVEIVKTTATAEEQDLLSSEKFLAHYEDGVSKGVFRKINPKQVLISIVGMNLIYFISQPIAQALLEVDDAEDEKKFLKERQDSVTDLLLYGIMEKRSS